MLAFLVLAALLPPSIADWLPSHPGDRWVYEVKILDRDNGHPHVEAWQEEIKTVAIRELPSGTLIERTVTLLNHTAPVRSAATWSPKSDILIRRNCLYFLTGKSSQPDSVPDVCFPLHAGAMWGDSAKNRDRWLASGQGHKQPTDEPASITPQSCVWKPIALLAMTITFGFKEAWVSLRNAPFTTAPITTIRYACSAFTPRTGSNAVFASRNFHLYPRIPPVTALKTFPKLPLTRL